MRHPLVFAILLGLGLAMAASAAAVAQNFYGTGSSYTGQKVPIQTLNAIDAEQRRQSASAAKLQGQQRQLDNDRQRAMTSGTKLGCIGKTAALSPCALEPMPQFDRRATTLEQEANEARRQSEERLRKLQNQQ